MAFDEEGNGVITKAELLKILKANHFASHDAEVARKADTIMAQSDKDGDGVITFDEFTLVAKKVRSLSVCFDTSSGLISPFSQIPLIHFSSPTFYFRRWASKVARRKAYCTVVALCLYRVNIENERPSKPTSVAATAITNGMATTSTDKSGYSASVKASKSPPSLKKSRAPYCSSR